jgi:hypothetical protein
MGKGSVRDSPSGGCIELLGMVNDLAVVVLESDAVANLKLHVLCRWTSTISLTMRFRSTWSVTASVADDDHWYGWMNLDIDQRMLSVGIVLGDEKG